MYQQLTLFPEEATPSATESMEQQPDKGNQIVGLLARIRDEISDSTLEWINRNYGDDTNGK